MGYAEDKAIETLRSNFSSDSDKLEALKVITKPNTPAFSREHYDSSPKKPVNKKKVLGICALTATTILGAREYRHQNKERSVQHLANCLHLDKEAFHEFKGDFLAYDKRKSVERIFRPMLETLYNPQMGTWNRVEIGLGSVVQPKILANDTNKPLTFQISSTPTESNYLVLIDKGRSRLDDNNQLQKIQVYRCVTLKPNEKTIKTTSDFIIKFPPETKS